MDIVSQGPCQSSPAIPASHFPILLSPISWQTISSRPILQFPTWLLSLGFCLSLPRAQTPFFQGSLWSQDRTILVRKPKKQLVFIQYLLCVRHGTKHSTCIILFHLIFILMPQGGYISLHFGDVQTEPNSTQVRTVRTRIQVPDGLFQILYTNHCFML